MTSIRRIQANQQNSQLSTGPRTPAGKAIVSQNALKTGFDARALSILGEDPFDFESLRAEYYDRWNPTAPEQRALVDTLIANEWLLRRYDRLETQLWQNFMPLDDRFNSETSTALPGTGTPPCGPTNPLSAN